MTSKFRFDLFNAAPRMPQQTDPATRTRICKVNESLAGEKLRVAGKFVAFSEYTI